MSHEPGAGVDAAARLAAYRALEARIFISDLSWCIPHQKPNVSQRKSRSEQTVSSSTKLANNKRSVQNKYVSTENK